MSPEQDQFQKRLADVQVTEANATEAEQQADAAERAGVLEEADALRRQAQQLRSLAVSLREFLMRSVSNLTHPARERGDKQ